MAPGRRRPSPDQEMEHKNERWIILDQLGVGFSQSELSLAVDVLGIRQHGQSAEHEERADWKLV